MIRSLVHFVILILITIAVPAQGTSPASLAVPSTISFSGTANTTHGPEVVANTLSINSLTTYTAVATTGTYSYLKIDTEKARLTYTSNYSFAGDTETESGTINVTFTSATGGTFTSSGSYSGREDGFDYNGVFTSSGTFIYTVPNTPPTISNVADQITFEDTITAPISFTVGDTQTAPGALTVTLASSNATLVPLARMALGGSGADRTLTINPAANLSGTSTITLTVSDGALTATDTFVLTVNALDDIPTISDVPDRVIGEDTATGAIAFTVFDVETPLTSLTVTRGSSNLALVPLTSVVIGGSGANRTVTITPAANQFGTSTVTLTVSDGGGQTATDTFILTVTPVNDPPTISDVTNKTTLEDTPATAIFFTVGDLETAPENISVTAGSSNPALVPVNGIVLGGNGASRTVIITPAPNQFGSSTITLIVSDGALSAFDTFVITVTSQPDPPTISDVADQAIVKNTATVALSFIVRDAESAATALNITRNSSNLTLVPLAGIVLGGSGENRTVTITPAANQTGIATITLIVSDGSLTATDTFVLSVTDGQTLASWRQTHFGSSANSGDGADMNDFDKDGLVNLMEYALGSLPKNGSYANYPFTGIEEAGGQHYLTMTVAKPPGVTGITWLVEVSSSLGGWSSGATTTVITNNANTFKVRDNIPATGGPRFIRLRVTSP